MRRLIVAAGLMAVAGTIAMALGQPAFRAGVDVVRIDASVMNGLVPVPGLTIDQFAITDNGVPQDLDTVSLDTVPLTLTIVLDTSASMEGERLKDLIDAGQMLVKSLRDEDAAALVTFSEAVRFPVPMTHDRPRLLKSLAELVAAGFTSLNDAAFLAMQLRPIESGDARSVLLIFSDGHDNTSWLTAARLIEATRRSGVLTHVVELMGGASTASFGPSEILSQLAEAGGGRRWIAQSSRDLRELFGKVLNEMRSRYLLTYVAKGVAPEGWHEVKVTLKGARGDVTARPGYFAAPQ
jgi:Ca-activated chloride channel family protein